MAGRRGSSSDSDSEIPPSAPRKSFSIETLLKRPEPPPRFRWDILFHRQCISKQVCPVPPNISVPPRFFETVPERKKAAAEDRYQLPDSSCYSISTSSKGAEEDDKNEGLDEGDGSHNERDLVSPPGVMEDESMVTGEDAVTFKKKRPRTAFSVSQIRTLEAEFERNRYLTGIKRKELSRELQLSETQIKIWFQNRRTKLKRKNVSEMENWVQQLYSPLGPMAPRPLVIGDHLYLFTTPAGETPPPCTPIYHPPFESWYATGHWPSYEH